MKSKFFLPIVLVAGLLLIHFSASSVYGQAPQNKMTSQLAVKYTCTQHPEVVQDQPGNCPICGKKLVEKKEMMRDEAKLVPDTTKMKPEPKPMKADTTMKNVPKMTPDTTYKKQDLR
jgi:hypothetical protein